METRRSWFELGDVLSARRQCELLGISRSNLYYTPATESLLNLELMKLIDEEYTRLPFYGSRKITQWLIRQGHQVNRKRIRRLMRLLGIEAIYAKPKTSIPNSEHAVYPYLLSDLEIVRPHQVWATDITYIRMRQGFLYLVAVMDWYSRYVLSWELSNTLNHDFCVDALERALEQGSPEIFNSDQGCQFTSEPFTAKLLTRHSRNQKVGHPQKNVVSRMIPR